jgi:hypothetical protein
METKLRITETEVYVLAVSDEEIKEKDYYITDLKEIYKCDKDSAGQIYY